MPLETRALAVRRLREWAAGWVLCRWARENGCPGKQGTLVAMLLRHGHLHVLQWAQRQRLPWENARNLARPVELVAARRRCAVVRRERLAPWDKGLLVLTHSSEWAYLEVVARWGRGADCCPGTEDNLQLRALNVGKIGSGLQAGARRMPMGCVHKCPGETRDYHGHWRCLAWCAPITAGPTWEGRMR